jgi:hypothetical protein
VPPYLLEALQGGAGAARRADERHGAALAQVEEQRARTPPAAPSAPDPDIEAKLDRIMPTFFEVQAVRGTCLSASRTALAEAVTAAAG